MEQIIGAAGARCIVREERHVEALDRQGVPALSLGGDPSHPRMSAPIGGSPEQPAFVFFTSGSTGGSKGVVLSHQALMSRQLAEQERIPLSPNDRMLFRTTISFDVLIRELFWPLIAGCPLVVVERGMTRHPHGLAAAIAEHDVTVAAVSPTLLRLILRVPEVNACTALRHVLSGGETLSKELQDKFYELFPEGNLYNIYGPTEAFTATFWSCPPDWEEDVVPIGHPTDLSISLVDSAGRPVSQGEVGEILISGIGVADGYLNASKEEARRFSAPLQGIGGERRYRSGDLAYERPDGALVFAGRVDDQVKLHGQRVELSEVERTLTGLDGVRDAAVTVRTDVGSTPVLIGYVVPSSADLDTNRLIELSAAELPSFMVPATIVQVEALPVGVTGKLDRTRLPRPELTEDVPEDASDESQLSEIESTVLAEVRRITGVASVQLDDELRTLPIDSLRLLELILDLEETVNIELGLEDLRHVASVRDLCTRFAEPGSRSPDTRGR